MQPRQSNLHTTASIADLMRLARRRLPGAVFDFVAGGAGDERTLAANSLDFSDWDLLPRVGVNVAHRDLETDFFGRRSTLPLFHAPTGGAGIYWPRGDIEAARAAGDAGVPFCLSINSVASIEEVSDAAQGTDLWFQLYALKDKAWMTTLMARARAARFRVLCLTLDVPVVGRRERDIRNGYSVPLRPTLRNVASVLTRPGWLLGAARHRVGFGNYPSERDTPFSELAKLVTSWMDPSADWDDAAAIRRQWDGPMIVKGLLTAADAKRALGLGADGVVVSNHGGRQLDGVPSSIRSLPAIVDAVGSRIPVFLDGGVRRGTDVMKARALGASACGLGRACLWGLAAAGRPGVVRALDLLRDELESGLALVGARSFGTSTVRTSRREAGRRRTVPRGRALPSFGRPGAIAAAHRQGIGRVV